MAYSAGMARMLYLRDIEVDVQVRCCACGHDGLLPRADLVRRFGPSYPVLSIAPHFRCSRCNSRNVESRPAPAEAMPERHRVAPETEAAFDAPLAALQGLLNAVRAPLPEPRTPEPPRASARKAPEKTVADTPPQDGGRSTAWAPISAADLDALTGDALTGDDAERTPEEDEWGPLPTEDAVPGKPVFGKPASDEAAFDDTPAAGTGRRTGDWTDEDAADWADEVEEADTDGRAAWNHAGDRAEEDDTAEEEPVLPERPPARPAASEGSLADTLAALRGILEADDEDFERTRRRAAPSRTEQDGGEDEEPSSAFAPPGAPLPRDPLPSFAEIWGEEEDGSTDGPPPAFSPRALVRDDYDEDVGEEGGWEDDKPAGKESEEEEPSSRDILGFAIRDPDHEPPPWERDRPPMDEEEPIDRTIEALRHMVQRAAADPASGAGRPAPLRKPKPPAARKPSGGGETATLPGTDAAMDAVADWEEDRESAKAPVRGEAAARPSAPAVEDPADDGPELDFKALLRDVAESGRGRQPDGKAGAFEPRPDEALDLVEEVKEPPAKAAAPTAFEKTISALRSMLELDGKRRR